MFGWFTQRHMQGGLVFGPPGWMPERIEETFGVVASPSDARPLKSPAVETPANRGALAALVERLGLTRTSDLIPGIGVQLKDLGDRPLQGLVLNLLPAEPESALGAALSRLALDDLVAGLQAIDRAVMPRKTWVALDRHDVHGWRLWKRATRRSAQPGTAPGGEKRPRPTIKMLLNRYPQANPTILLWSLVGQRLPVGTLPSSPPRGSAGGWLMVDPITCWGLGRHLRTGQPFEDRPVQVFVQGAEPRLVMGRLGEPLPDFCTRHGITQDLAKTQVIVNGMLTGWQVAASKMRIDGRTESITLRDPAPPEDPSPCIACGWCVDVCPTGLTPVTLMELAQLSAAESGRVLRSREARESRHCIACGLCTYVCPTRLPLMEQVLELQVRVSAVKAEARNAS